jgi:hypothetical protein
LTHYHFIFFGVDENGHFGYNATQSNKKDTSRAEAVSMSLRFPQGVLVPNAATPFSSYCLEEE